MSLESLFAVAPNDQSIYYLGQLFGSVGNIIEPNGPGVAVIGLLGMMFRTFNTTALILGAILVTHTTVVGLLKTANEGEFLGKQWNSMWVPLRMVMGIAALFPTTSGYSSLQVIMMWFIVQGVGAADTLWNTVINYVALAGSPYATISMPATGLVQQNMENLYKALVCEATALRKDSDVNTSTNKYYYYCGDPANAASTFCTSQQSLKLLSDSGNCYTNSGAITCKIGPNGSCGSVTYSDLSSCSDNNNVGSILQCVAAEGQQQALKKIIDPAVGLANLATQFAEFDHEYLQFYANVNPAPTEQIWYGVYTPASSGGSCKSTAITTPDWIQNYCAADPDLSVQGKCCVYNTRAADTPACLPEQVGSGSPSATNCQDSSSMGGPFYGATDCVGSGKCALDVTNASPNAVKNVYWPYGIKPLLENTDATNAASNTPALQLNNKVDFVKAAVSYYASAIGEKLANQMTSAASRPINLNDWQSSAERMGWLLAGAYYYEIANQNDDNTSKAIPPFVVKVTAADSGSSMKRYRNNVNAADALIKAIIQEELPPSSTAASTPGFEQVGSQLNGLASSIVGDFMTAISGSSGRATNPLVALQHLGRNLLITAQVMYAVFLAIVAVALIAGSINIIALGTGMTESPVKNFLIFLMNSLWTILLAFMAWCITFGGMLAVYVPLIPYILFTMGAIGWFTATIEAMVAAPLVALGILSPGGQSETLGRGGPAIMIMLNIFLRPSLMIMGMMSGMLLATIVVSMINSGFKGVMGSINGTPGLPELIMFISAYCTIVVTALNKCFSLIHVIPSQVMSWIEGGAGHKAGVGGEEAAAEAVKGAVKGAAESTASGATKSVGAAKQMAKKAIKNADKAKSQLKGE